MKYYNRTEQAKARILRAALAGEAKRLIESAKLGNTDQYAQMMAKLDEYYGAQTRPEAATKRLTQPSHE